MSGKQPVTAPAAACPAEGATLETRRGMSPALRWTLFAAIVVGYALIAALISFLAGRSGNYLDGVDAMFYVHRGDFLYRSITQEGNWFPLLDMSWYNGVQTWRYWSAVPAYVLAGCQAIMGGSVNNGFLLFVGLLYFVDGVVWLHIGRTHGRPWLGALFGFLWFFVPNTSAQMLLSEGVLARAMTMPILPLLFVYLHDYLHGPRRWSALPKLILCFIGCILCHIGWAGMVAITVVIYLLFYRLTHHKKEARQPVWPILCCVGLAFLLSGLALYPSLKGGITQLDSSDVMATYFQNFWMSVNPFAFVKEGAWNRWTYAEAPYYGLSALLMTVLGILCARKDTRPGFLTPLTILLMSTPTAYTLLKLLPGNQYLWMTRFLSIALCVFLVAVFFWRSLKKQLLWVFAAAFAVECLCLVVLVTRSTNPLSPDEYHAKLADEMLIDEGKAVTHQRMSIIDPYDVDIDGIYVIAGFGEERRATSFGQGVQAAVNYRNIAQVNESALTEQYLYLFDRSLELGNDTLIIPMSMGSSDRQRNADDLDTAAGRVGYSLVDSSDSYRLYHLDAAPEGAFGVVSAYRAAAIGSDAGSIALGFPAVEELEGVVLDEYSYDELKRYDVLYLAGFTYESKEAAEQLVLDLSESGTRVLILADGIPDEEHTGSKTFLGVSCNRVNFQNGYPALDTIDGVLYCDLFPSGYAKDWQTVYVNGLDEVWGTITDVPEGKMDFYGTVKNDNIVVIGLALTYHYSLTQDAAVGRLLSHALTLDPSELPQREIVPLTVDYHDNVITVDSPGDDVNTTLSYHDIFRSDQNVREQNHLTVVDQGRTTIRLVYPYLVPSLLLTLAGVVLTAGFLFWMKKRLNAAAKKEREAAEAPPETPPEPPAAP